MSKLINIIGIAMFFILSLFSFVFSQESMTITTYYPSPYGSYRQLSVTSPDGANLTGFLVNIRNDDVTGNESHGLLIRAGNDLNDLPLQILNRAGTRELLRVRGDGNVGIGTNNPTEKLSVFGINPGVGSALVYNTTNGNFYFTASSLRYKDNIQDFSDDFHKILQAKPKSFTWKTTKAKDIGYIAEDFDKLGLNNLVVYDKEGKPDAVKYDKLALYMLEIIKDQQKQIDELKAQLNIKN